MSTSATGRILDDQSTPQGLANLVVVIRDESALFSSDLGNAASATDGSFTVPYGGDLTPELGTRKLGISVFTQSHRQLYSASVDDVPGAILSLSNITVPRAEAAGWTVTLGGSASALPVREGNAVRFLIDNEAAWGHVADAMEGAVSSIDVMQLEFDVPPEYLAAPPSEQPEIVLSFDAPVDPQTPRKVLDAKDYRPERILLDKASSGLKVRVIMPHQDLTDVPAGVFVIEIFLALVFLALAPVGAYVVSKYWPLLRGWKNLLDYLAAAGSTADDQGFRVTPFNVVHAKLVLVDDTEAIVVGSPFNQSYWDTGLHQVYEPRRGSASGEPVGVHDVSLGVRGPAVKDMHDAFQLHWNASEPGAAVPDIPVPPAITATNPGEDAIASLQLVRTLNAGAFPSPLDKGERGILEAYLRAIEGATQYIYLENQYFTNDTIGDALVAALNDTTRPKLQIIVMINVTPDIPMYPTWQAKLIQRIRKGAGANAERIEFFSAWTHDPPMPSQKHVNPMIMPNYLHTKGAIVDGLWATLGSANLDGASLDAFQLLHALQFGDNVNHELNYLFFNGIDGHPAAGAGVDAIDLLRRRLWGEHLGIDPTSTQLDASKGDWLTLWKTTADAKRLGLTDDPATTPRDKPALGRILKYPPDVDKTIVTAQGAATVTAGPATDPRGFLQNLSIPLDHLDLVEQVRSFSFGQGKWV
jgi:phosphatidylserine/phosphatidylglycerophosphate/cardiolipin synthase-like enzyme